jgi:hypothetical protein
MGLNLIGTVDIHIQESHLVARKHGNPELGESSARGLRAGNGPCK